MAMRVTTKMMQGNSLSNLNTNKALQDKLTTQLSTLKKITRPSDDPVIAIRSLRLNCTLSKIDQYYEKNSKDAKAWLKLTDDSLDTVSEILTSMRTYATQCSNGDLKAEDRENITKNLAALKEEIYAVGNADYEGRSIFAGYRTGLPLTFQEDFTKQYSITEQISNHDFDTTTFVRTGDLSEINEGNYLDKSTQEYDVGTYEIHRFRTSYSKLDNTAASIQFAKTLIPTTDVSTAAEIEIPGLTGKKFQFVNGSDGKKSFYMDGTEINIANGGGNYTDLNGITGLNMSNVVSDNGVGVLKLSYTNTATPPVTNSIEVDYTVAEDGTLTFDDQYFQNVPVTKSFENATDDAYMEAVNNDDAVVYIAETGEILFGKDVYQDLSALNENTEIRVTYDKSKWLDGDLNPVHYFYTQDKTQKKMFYNSEKLVDPEGNTANQVITYDMGNNQKLQVNTTADEAFTHDIGRDIEELSALLDDITELEKVQTKVKAMVESGEYSGDDLTHLEKQLEALNKSMTYLNDKLQSKSENYISNFSDYLDRCDLALTKVGSREARQKLIDNRLGTQQTTFEELVSSNEDADLSELAVQLSSVELTYEAALSSISYVMKTTLLDFI